MKSSVIKKTKPKFVFPVLMVDPTTGIVHFVIDEHNSLAIAFDETHLERPRNLYMIHAISPAMRGRLVTYDHAVMIENNI